MVVTGAAAMHQTDGAVVGDQAAGIPVVLLVLIPLEIRLRNHFRIAQEPVPLIRNRMARQRHRDLQRQLH